MSQVEFYHFSPSGPSRGALLAARAVGIPLDIKIIDLFKKEQLNPEFIKINPQHTVPTIKDGDFVLWDSHAIASYLVQTYSEDDKLYPRNPQQKAIVDQRLYFDMGTLYARIRNICFPVLFLGETTISNEKKESLEEALGWMDIFLTGRPWIAGTDMTIADCACAASVSSIFALGYDLSKHKKTNEWFAKCTAEMPGFDENLEGAKIFAEVVRSKLGSNENINK